MYICTLLECQTNTNRENMTTIWKCSEDPSDITHELTGQVSTNRNILLLCRWANGKVGAIFPVNDSLILCFSEVKAGSRNDPKLDFMPTQERLTDNSDINSHIISCGGIVAHWLLNSCGLHPVKTGLELFKDFNFRKNILYTLRERPYIEPLYESHLEKARTTARKDFELKQNLLRTQPGSWKPENKREFEFSLEDHLKEERRILYYDERNLFPFFRREDIEFMRAIAQDYQEYIQYKLDNSSISEAEEGKKTKGKKPKEDKPFVPTQDTFKIENTTEERLKLIFQFCIDQKWLDGSTRVEDWLLLFKGVPSPVLMVWKKEKSPALRDLFWMMDRDEDAEQKTFLESRRNYLHVVSSHFVSKKPSKGNPPAYITDFGGRNNQKQYEQPIELCRRILAWPKDKEIDLNALIYEMAEEQEKRMIDEAQTDNVSINKENAALQQGQRTSRETIRHTKIK